MEGKEFCSKCSESRLGYVVETLNGGLCECCGNKEILWVRKEREPLINKE